MPTQYVVEFIDVIGYFQMMADREGVRLEGYNPDEVVIHEANCVAFGDDYRMFTKAPLDSILERNWPFDLGRRDSFRQELLDRVRKEMTRSFDPGQFEYHHYNVVQISPTAVYYARVPEE